MKLIAGTGIEIELSHFAFHRQRLHIQEIGGKIISPLVRAVRNRIIKIEIKPEHRVRNSHLQLRLMHFHQLAFIIPAHDHRRIKILTISGRADKGQ